MDTPTATARRTNRAEAQLEAMRSAEDSAYFVHHFCTLYDPEAGDWIPFRLWPAQLGVLETLDAHRLLVILKARQLGQSWLLVAYALWLLLFRASATVLLFSRRDSEAVDLLAMRLRGMYLRLPPWLRCASLVVDNDHELEFSNGSRAKAFPTTAGDSYSASMAIVDEADLIPDLDRLLRAVKPTVDAGGRMVLLGRVDKGRAVEKSPFKRIYMEAKDGHNAWTPVFLPWYARPDRTPEWYEEQKQDALSRTGSLDALYEQYPATDAEALAPNALDKRIPPDWLLACYRPQPPIDPTDPDLPALPGLRVYVRPQPGRTYICSADPAEGNPSSDDSAAVVLDLTTGEECASLAGKFQPGVFAHYTDVLGRWYNRAPLRVERNNHGHAVLLWLADHSTLRRLPGEDGRPGWLTNSKSKAMLYTHAAEVVRGRRLLIHTPAVYRQLGSIEGSTLRAPEGEMDDLATAVALCTISLERRRKPRQPSSSLPRERTVLAPGLTIPGHGDHPWLADLDG